MTEPLIGPDYQNYTRTSLEGFLLLAWTSISFVLGIFGNILVLVAAYRRGIRIDKTSLLVIKNLASSDILFNLIWVLPTLTTLIADTWVLGNTVCHVTTYLQYTTAIATICFITIFSLNKFIRCKFPLKSWKISTAAGYLITTAVWTFAFVHPAMYFVGNLVREDKRRIMLYPPKSSCDYYHGLDLSTYWQRIDLLCAVLYTFLPSMILIVVNVGLIRLVKQKEKRSFNKSNLTLILIITVVFIVSYAPYVVKYSIPILGMKTDVLSNWFKTLMNFMLYTNSWFNPFAYYSTNAAFRKFIHCTMRCKRYRANSCSIVTSNVIIENSTSVFDPSRMRSNSLIPTLLRSPYPHTPHQRKTVCLGTGGVPHMLPVSPRRGSHTPRGRVRSPRLSSPWRPGVGTGCVLEDSNESAETLT